MQNITGEYRIHAAAKTGNIEKLEKLLKNGNGDPKEIDDYKQTPLHVACNFGHQSTALEMVRIILKHANGQSATQIIDGKKLVDYQDKYSQTALHLAAIRGHAFVVKELLFSGANPNLRDCDDHDALYRLYKKQPAAITPTYDDSGLDCKEDDFNNQNPNATWNFDFVAIASVPEPGPDDSRPFFGPETQWLKQCLELSENKQKVIFMHPAVQTFLLLKWEKIRIMFWSSIFYHIAWLIFYTYFNVDLYLLHCPFKNPNEENATDSGESRSALDITGVVTYCDLWDHYTRLNSELWLLFMMTVTISVKELYEMYSSGVLKYFQQLENIGQWTVVGIVFLASIPVFRVDDSWGVGIYEWQYQASAFGILLACSLTLSQIGKIPKFGIYVLILAKVVRSFIMFMITFAAILMAFMIAFQILMPEKEEFRDNPWGFIRVLVMMTGEINYDDLFHSELGHFQLPFPISTKLLLAAFIAVVTIILFNLLIGLTVSDIQGLQSGAALNSLSIQVEEVNFMETFLTSFYVQKLLDYFGKKYWLQYFRVTGQNHDPEIINSKTTVKVLVKKIPKELQRELTQLASKSNPNHHDNEEHAESFYRSEPSNADVKALSKNTILNATQIKKQIDALLKQLLDEVQQNNSNA